MSKLKKLVKFSPLQFVFLLTTVLAIIVASLLFTKEQDFKNKYATTENDKKSVEVQLASIKAELDEIKSQDQVKVNQDLNATIKDIEVTYTSAVGVYESLLKLKEKTDNTESLDNLFTESLTLLSDKQYATASAKLKELDGKITDEEKKIAEAAAAKTTADAAKNAPVNNTPPGSGYSRQSVSTDSGTYVVSMVASDIGSTRIIVDTASSGDCGNDCPVMSLADYVSRNGAFAGINGTYFCPASYPSCAGKTNTFDLLVMNKDKHYFNSDNNVYSNNPAVIFGNGYVRFVSSASQWGRDTGVDGVISNYPLLVFNKNVIFGGDDDPKKGSIGNRSFVANKGNTVYIGVVHSATVAGSARALAGLGMDNAMNLDSGGSTALWSGGYKAGPGRNIPNAVLFVKR